MPAPLGPLVGIALGAALALLARDPERADRVFTRRTIVVLLFAVLVYAPACAYFPIFAADWSWLYLVEAARVPSALVLVLVIADAASVVAGWLGAQRGLARNDARAAVALAAAPAGIALTSAVVFAHELRSVGTTREMRLGFGAESIGSSAVGFAVLWMAVMVAAGMVIAARSLGTRDVSVANDDAKREDAEAPPSTAKQDPPRRLGRGRR